MSFMLLDYAYLLRDYDASFFNDNTQTSEFIFPINGQITSNVAEVLQTLLQSKNHFSFYIPFELTKHSHSILKEEIIQNIIRLLFLPNYLRVNQKPVLFTEKVSREYEVFELLKNEFYVGLRKQGINDFIVEELESNPSFQNIPNEKSVSLYDRALSDYLNGGGEECFQTLANNFAFPQNFYKKWIVPITNQDDLRGKIKRLEKFENWMSQTNPLAAKLVVMYRLATDDNTKLKSENSILRFKLESSAEALKLIREEAANYISEVSRLRHEVDRLTRLAMDPTINFPNKLNEERIAQLQTQIDAEHKRADEILAWYKKEYEILPIWYKRFGHVVKVFKGERTFKSLFK